jgi:hypothetical protein
MVRQVFYHWAKSAVHLIEQRALKDVNNCLNTNIYSFLETSGGKSSNLYLNGVHFCSTPVLIRHLWQLKTIVFHIGIQYALFYETEHSKKSNNCLNTNIYSYLETSGGKSYTLYLNVVHFINTSVN